MGRTLRDWFSAVGLGFGVKVVRFGLWVSVWSFEVWDLGVGLGFWVGFWVLILRFSCWFRVLVLAGIKGSRAWGSGWTVKRVYLECKFYNGLYTFTISVASMVQACGYWFWCPLGVRFRIEGSWLCVRGFRVLALTA